VGHKTLRTGAKILTDIAERKPTDATTAGDLVFKHVTESAENLICKLRGCGRKRTHGAAVAGGNKKKGSQGSSVPRKKYYKGTYFPSFISVTLQQPIMSAAAEIASV